MVVIYVWLPAAVVHDSAAQLVLIASVLPLSDGGVIPVCTGPRDSTPGAQGVLPLVGQHIPLDVQGAVLALVVQQ